jgi:hypothetical protein
VHVLGAEDPAVPAERPTGVDERLAHTKRLSAVSYGGHDFILQQTERAQVKTANTTKANTPAEAGAFEVA